MKEPTAPEVAPNPTAPAENLPETQNTDQAEITAASKKINLKGFLLETAEIVVMVLVLTLLINWLSARVRVENVSMQPTLHQGELLLVNKLAYLKETPKTGDVVVFHAPPEPGEDFIKRVIGAPGDQVIIQDGQVFVNDELLQEGYIASSPDYNGSWDVPLDAVFVLGDNRNSSSDSHTWGYVPLKNIVGKALLVYWPVSDMTLLEHKLPQTSNQ